MWVLVPWEKEMEGILEEENPLRETETKPVYWLPL